MTLYVQCIGAAAWGTGSLRLVAIPRRPQAPVLRRYSDSLSSETTKTPAGEAGEQGWHGGRSTTAVSTSTLVAGKRGVGGGRSSPLPPPPPCDIPSGCCFFTGPWTVPRSLFAARCSIDLLPKVRPATVLTPPFRFLHRRRVGLVKTLWVHTVIQHSSVPSTRPGPLRTPRNGNRHPHATTPPPPRRFLPRGGQGPEPEADRTPCAPPPPWAQGRAPGTSSFAGGCGGGGWRPSPDRMGLGCCNTGLPCPKACIDSDKALHTLFSGGGGC